MSNVHRVLSKAWTIAELNWGTGRCERCAVTNNWRHSALGILVGRFSKEFGFNFCQNKTSLSMSSRRPPAQQCLWDLRKAAGSVHRTNEEALYMSKCKVKMRSSDLKSCLVGVLRVVSCWACTTGLKSALYIAPSYDIFIALGVIGTSDDSSSCVCTIVKCNLVRGLHCWTTVRGS